ncbi:MAG: DUF3826 domain-containing protein [Chitinophagaceae bacterium]
MKRATLAMFMLQSSSATKRSFPITLYVTTIIIACLCSGVLCAQPSSASPTAEYQNVIRERVKKIVDVLDITDSKKYNNTLETISSQYFALNDIHEKSKEKVGQIKKDVQADKQAEEIKKEEEIKSGILKQQHDKFIAQLKKDLNDAQVEKVKNGMTYNVLNVTYTAYQDMIPSLTADQKEKIYAWLLEARELAMDAESSDKKHAVFGKYKGRINNYLSQAGYDMKKEEKAWQARIREKKEKQAEANN